jgi:glucose/arabinose dehydrogenase
MATHRIFAVFSALAALSIAGCHSSQTQSRPAPSTKAGTSTGALGTPPPAGREPVYPRARGIHVPAGYAAQVYARGLTQPTAMALGPDHRLYVTQNDGRVVVARPVPDRPRTYASGFTVPLGLAWAGERLYVSAQGTLYELKGHEPVPLVTFLPFGLHQQDNVVVAPNGRLYFGSGSTCNACAEADERSAAVLSVEPSGKGLRIEASGLRNPYGLAFRPGTAQLFVSVNGRDDLGDDNPAESVVVLRRGADYGWPGCWPDWGTRKLAGPDCAGVSEPLAYLEPHSSADGIAFWRGSLFVAEWGEYYSHAHGRRVVRVDPDTGKVRSFASGFEHPLALAVDRYGALLVADFGRGIVYRIRKSGG